MAAVLLLLFSMVPAVNDFSSFFVLKDEVFDDFFAGTEGGGIISFCAESFGCVVSFVCGLVVAEPFFTALLSFFSTSVVVEVVSCCCCCS